MLPPIDRRQVGATELRPDARLLYSDQHVIGRFVLARDFHLPARGAELRGTLLDVTLTSLRPNQRLNFLCRDHVRSRNLRLRAHSGRTEKTVRLDLFVELVAAYFAAVALYLAGGRRGVLAGPGRGV